MSNVPYLLLLLAGLAPTQQGGGECPNKKAIISKPSSLEIVGEVACKGGLRRFKFGELEIEFEKDSCPKEILYKPAEWDFADMTGATWAFNGNAFEHRIQFSCLPGGKGCSWTGDIVMTQGTAYPQYMTLPCKVGR